MRSHAAVRLAALGLSIPSGLAVITSDSFTRSNGAPGSTDAAAGGVAKAWILQGTWVVNTNKLQHSASASGDDYSPNSIMVDSGVTDSITSFVYSGGLQDAAALGLIVRYVDANNYYRFLLAHNGASYDYYVQKTVAGVTTTLYDGTGLGANAVDGSVFAFQVKASTLKVTKNGATIYSTSDASLASGTKVGILDQKAGSAVNRYDDFVVSAA